MNYAKTTQVPARFQIDPLDALAYDRWQDREGLQDASDACKVAWKLFEKTWRADRRRTLSRGKCKRAEWIEGIEVDDLRGACRILALLDQGRNASPVKIEARERWEWAVAKYDVHAADRFERLMRGKSWIEEEAAKAGVSERFLVCEVATLGRLAASHGA